MKKTITLNTFRRMQNLEESMMRAVMPRTSAADVLPLQTDITPREVVRTVGGVRLVKIDRRERFAPLTATLAEVARG